MFTGLIGKKIEMTQLFQPDGSVIPVTVLEVGPCVVTQIKTAEKNHYQAVQLGFGHQKRKLLSKPILGHLQKIRQKPQVFKEFPIESDEKEIKLGQKIKVDEVFTLNEKVEVQSISKGKGFAGVVKRHNFRGGPKTHGQSDRHRAPGSIGGRTTPGRVYRGKKMAGRMGGEQITVKGLEIVEIDAQKNRLKIKGAIPGYRGTTVFIEKQSNT